MCFIGITRTHTHRLQSDQFSFHSEDDDGQFPLCNVCRHTDAKTLPPFPFRPYCRWIKVLKQFCNGATTELAALGFLFVCLILFTLTADDYGGIWEKQPFRCRLFQIPSLLLAFCRIFLAETLVCSFAPS